MIDPRQTSATARRSRPQLALRVAALGVVALVHVRDRLLPPLVPAGAVGRPVPRARPTTTGSALVRVQAPRGAIVDRDGRTLVENRQATVDPARPTSLPDERARRRQPLGSGGRRCACRPAQGPPRRRQIALPPVPYVAGQNLQARYTRLGSVLGVSVHDDPARGHPAARAHAVRAGDDQDRRRRGRCATTSPSARRTSRASTSSTSTCAVPLPPAGRADRSARRPGQPEAELKGDKYRGVKQGTIIGQDGLEYSYDRYLRGRDGLTRIVVDATGNPTRTDTQRAGRSAGRQLQLSLDLGLQRAGAGGDGARRRRPARRVRRAGPAQRRGARDGLVPELRPAILSQPITPGGVRRSCFGDAGRRAALRPRDRRLLSDRLDVQADHRDGGADARRHHARHADQRPGLHQVGLRSQQFCNAGKAANGTRRLRRALQVSSDVFFYTLGARPQRAARHQPLQTLGAQARPRAAGPASTCPARSSGLIPDRAWRDADQQRRSSPARSARTHGCCGISDKRAVDTSATTSTSPSARATCRPRRCRWRSPTRRSPTAARSCGRTSASRSRTPAARLVQQLEPAGAPRHHDRPERRQAIMDGLHARGQRSRAARRPTSGRRLAPGPLPGLRQDRHRRAPSRTATSPGTSPTPRRHAKHRPIVVAVTVEEGGFGAEAAAPARA